MTQSETIEPKTTGKRVILILVVLGILVVSFFGFRTVRSFIRIQRTGLQSGTTDVEAIRGWMTVPYIAKAYKVPVEVLYQEIGISPEGNNKSSISDLNYKYFFGKQGLVLEKVKTAIQRFKSEHKTPPGSGQ